MANDPARPEPGPPRNHLTQALDATVAQMPAAAGTPPSSGALPAVSQLPGAATVRMSGPAALRQSPGEWWWIALSGGLVVALLAVAWARTTAARSLESRRQQILALSPAEKESLLRKYERFSQLDRQEQERLRQLHGQLEQAPDGAELQAVLTSYHEWLNKLSPIQRAELLALEPQARFERIDKVRQEELQRSATLLSAADQDVLLAWIEELLRRKLPDEPRVVRFLQLPPEERRGMLLWVLSSRSMMPGSWRPPEMSGEDLDALAKALSPAGRLKLEKQNSSSERQRLVYAWIGQAVRESNARLFGRLLADVSEADLVRHFESMPDEKRRELLEQSPEIRQQRLRVLYLMAHKPNDLPLPMRMMEWDWGKPGTSRPGEHWSGRDGPSGGSSFRPGSGHRPASPERRPNGSPPFSGPGGGKPGQPPGSGFSRPLPGDAPPPEFPPRGAPPEFAPPPGPGPRPNSETGPAAGPGSNPNVPPRPDAGPAAASSED